MLSFSKEQESNILAETHLQSWITVQAHPDILIAVIVLSHEWQCQERIERKRAQYRNITYQQAFLTSLSPKTLLLHKACDLQYVIL